jgi:hypothetical protein
VSRRPDFETGGRGRPRYAGERGPIDPRALPAATLDGADTATHCISFTTSGNPLQGVTTDAYTREILDATSLAGGLTLSAWIKMDGAAPGTGDGVMSGSDAISAAAFGLSMGPTLASGLNFWITAQNTAANRAISPALVLANWNHFIGTFNPSGSPNTVSGYLNGSNAGWTNGTLVTAPTLEAGVPFLLGSNFFRNSSATTYWEGKLYGIMIWNRAITAAEAALVYNGGSARPALTPALLSGLRLWWNPGNSYQDRQRGFLRDRTGNGFHGRIRQHGGATVGALATFAADAP